MKCFSKILPESIFGDNSSEVLLRSEDPEVIAIVRYRCSCRILVKLILSVDVVGDVAIE